MSVPGFIIQVSACNLGAELEHEVVLFCQLNTPNALLPPSLLPPSFPPFPHGRVGAEGKEIPKD